MNDYLKTYIIRIRTKSPVFVGDGSVINNREYIYLQRSQRIIVPNLERMYMAIKRKGQEAEFQEYVLGEKFPLGTWLRNHGFSEAEYDNWKFYELDTSDFAPEMNTRTGKPRPPQDIQRFVKDIYGCPYVPGSSLKGVLRTALLSYLVKQQPEKYKHILGAIRDAAQIPASKKRYLQRETSQLEQAVFHTLNRNEKRKQDAVNSVLAGLIVSDSKPLRASDLTLCQKIDYSINRLEKKLPILREAIKPDTAMEFQISIDSSLFPYSIETIQSAIDAFNELYWQRFASKFGMGSREPGIIWIGGGEGFAVKTVIHALYDEQTAYQLSDQIFQKTLGGKYNEHHHEKDLRRGIAPHMYKCTHYLGELVDFGMARIETIDEI